MKISEIFYSIQGEGGLVGMPSVFVRTSGCNLRCTWCDTPYTSWNPEGRNMSLGEIELEIEQFHASHAVVTGGEPMIAPEIVPLTRTLRARGIHITIETAGTVDAAVDCDLMSISPKLSNSTPHEREGGRWAAQHERLRYQPDVISSLLSRYPSQLKFVVCSPEDLDEIRRMVDQLPVRRSNIFLMPEGTRSEVLRERALWLTEVCKTEGFRFSPRLHVDLWGDRRGV